MKITIIGSHGTGKTTLAKELSEYLTDHFFIPELARVWGIEKVPIEKRTFDLQYKMYQNQMDIESYHENFISDRSVMDFAVYSGVEWFIQSTRTEMDRYTHIFYIPVKENLHTLMKDGFRNIDKNYQREIDMRFNKNMPDKTIVILEDTIENRVKEVLSYL